VGKSAAVKYWEILERLTGSAFMWLRIAEWVTFIYTSEKGLTEYIADLTVEQIFWSGYINQFLKELIFYLLNNPVKSLQDLTYH